MTLHQPLHRPDPAACGCDEAIGLVPVDEAIARALALVRPLDAPECLPLGAASGRVLAQAITAPAPLPLFDNAAMDGYALRLSDLAGQGPWHLPVTGRIGAGDAPCPLPQGAALRILTGAPMPAGADAVIAQERVILAGEGITITAPPAPGQHIRRRGDDVVQGAPLLAAGRLIDPRAAAALGGSGVARVPVQRRLRVATLCSGSELVAPGATLAPGQIWDANQPMLAAALAKPWITRIPLPICADDPAALSEALTLAAAQADLIVTTGGVSVGDADHMARVVGGIGGRVAVMKLAMKPGKPMGIGQVGGALWLGLPGNPVAAFVAWQVVGQVLVGTMAGLAGAGPVKSLAALSAPVRHKPGRCEYRPAQVLGHDARGVLQVACLEGAGAHRVAQLAQADALVMIPSDAESLPRGALVEVLCL